MDYNKPLNGTLPCTAKKSSGYVRNGPKSEMLKQMFSAPHPSADLSRTSGSRLSSGNPPAAKRHEMLR